MSTIGYLCGCPETECVGSMSGDVSNSMRNLRRKVHGSRRDARRCYIRYLLRQGYTRTDNASCFASPDDGPVIVLNRESKFGGELRSGKAKRYMPKRRTGGLIY